MSYEEDIAFGVQQMLDADLQFPQEVHVRNVVKNNAQRIRSMTDEELSVLLSKPWCENHRLPEECASFDTDCEACALAWLCQPAEEDT